MNSVFIILITAGGLGFYVLIECASFLKAYAKRLFKRKQAVPQLSWHSKIVLNTSLFLVVAGTVVIFLAEGAAGNAPESWWTHFWTALFQSVTCRTAGFNTVDIGGMTNVSLVFMMLLMVVGGSPGSCAGGIKTTTFRALCAFVGAQFKGRSQVQIGRFALTPDGLHKMISLVTTSFLLIFMGTMVLTALESGGSQYLMAREEFLINMFETVSAFATVGLSTGVTPFLDDLEKVTVIVLMFVGRLGPIWLLSALQSWQVERRYKVPTGPLPFG